MDTNSRYHGPQLIDAVTDIDPIVDRLRGQLTHTLAELDQLHALLVEFTAIDPAAPDALDRFLAIGANDDSVVTRWAALRTVQLAVTAEHLSPSPLPLPVARTSTRQARLPLPPLALGVLRVAARRGRQRTRLVSLLEAGASQTEIADLDWSAIQPGWPPTIALPGSVRVAPRTVQAPAWTGAALERRAETGRLLGNVNDDHGRRVALVSQTLKATSELAGLRPLRVTPDTVRHTVAAELRRSNGLEAAARYLGVRSLDRVRMRLGG